MSDMQTSKASSVAQRDAQLADHRWMDGELERLIAAFEADDAANVDAIWGELFPFLCAHMESEEDLLYPTLARWSPESVTSLIAEHDEIRELLERLSVSLELHTARLEAAVALANCLRVHARREDVLLFGISSARDRSAEASRLAHTR